MTDETLARALGSLRTVRMSEIASDRVRDELEAAWRTRTARPRRSGFAIPSFVRAVAVAAGVLAVAYATVNASADTPLYAARIAVEDAFVALQSDPVAYVTELYDERLAEAAHQEATGNALAASRARQATEDALRLLNQVAPRQNDEAPSPEPTGAIITLPSPTLSPEPTVTPTPSPTPTAAPPRTPLPTTAKTPTPAPPKPTPPPTPTQFAVHATGTVQYADGTPVNEACVSTSSTAGSCIATTTNGSVDFWFIGRKGDTLSFYLTKADVMTGRTYRGKVTITVQGPSAPLGTTTLRLV